jgi:phage terminase Nu1 subunit (DNA packaging protein)
MNNINKMSPSEERKRMIGTAAYYRAEKRGFSNGDSIKDWLEAEKEIGASFKVPIETDSSKQERAAYQRMRAEFKKILAGAQDTINADTIKQAFDRAGRELRELGEFVPETVDRAGKRLKQEVAAAVEKIGPRWGTFSEKGHGLFEIWKDKGGQFVNQAHIALNSWVNRHRAKNGKKKNENDANGNGVKS